MRWMPGKQPDLNKWQLLLLIIMTPASPVLHNLTPAFGSFIMNVPNTSNSIKLNFPSKTSQPFSVNDHCISSTWFRNLGASLTPLHALQPISEQVWWICPQTPFSCPSVSFHITTILVPPLSVLTQITAIMSNKSPNHCFCPLQSGGFKSSLLRQGNPLFTLNLMWNSNI